MLVLCKVLMEILQLLSQILNQKYLQVKVMMNGKMLMMKIRIPLKLNSNKQISILTLTSYLEVLEQIHNLIMDKTLHNLILTTSLETLGTYLVVEMLKLVGNLVNKYSLKSLTFFKDLVLELLQVLVLYLRIFSIYYKEEISQTQWIHLTKTF